MPPSDPPEFDQYAAEYDKLLADPLRDGFVQNPEFFHLRKWILLQKLFAEHSFTPRNADWLDVGCGRAELLRLGKSSFRNVSGCDPSASMLQHSGHLNVVRQTDPRRLPFPDASFDLVTAVCVYHHVPPPERAALTTEVKRVLRSGGWFVIIEHNPFNPVTRLIVSRTPVDADAILLSCKETRNLQHKAGLHPVAAPYFLFLPEPLFGRLGGVESLLQWLPLGGQYACLARKPQ